MCECVLFLFLSGLKIIISCGNNVIPFSDKDEVRSISSFEDHSEEGSDLKPNIEEEEKEEVIIITFIKNTVG